MSSTSANNGRKEEKARRRKWEEELDEMIRKLSSEQSREAGTTELDMIANLVANDALQYANANGAAKQSAFVQHHQHTHHAAQTSQHHLALEHSHMLAASNGVHHLQNGGLNAYSNRLPSTSSSSTGCSASCSPTSSEALNGLLQRSRPPSHHQQQQQQHHMNNLLRTCSEGGLDSPLGMSGLLGNGAIFHNNPIKTEPLDVSGLMGINPMNSNFQHMSLAGTSAVPPTSGLGGLTGLNFHNQGGPRSAPPNPASHLTVPELSLSLNVPTINNSVTSTATTPKPRQRSSLHDSMMKCRYCPKKFRTEKLLEAHKIECRVIRIHECTICGKRFKARGGLQQHHRIHIQDKPYICKYCPKRFTQKSHVDQHERIHTGDKPFTCTYCGRHFRQRSQQLGHEATHSHSGMNLLQQGTNGRPREAPAAIIAIKEEARSPPVSQSSNHSSSTGPVINDLAAMALGPSHATALGDLHNFDVQQALDMMSSAQNH